MNAVFYIYTALRYSFVCFFVGFVCNFMDIVYICQVRLSSHLNNQENIIAFVMIRVVRCFMIYEGIFIFTICITST